MSFYNKSFVFIFLILAFAYNGFSEELSIFETLKISDSQEELKSCKTELIALNKITAKSKKVNLSEGMNTTFDNLLITIDKSFTNLSKKESGSLISVLEQKIDSDPVLLFHGWITNPKQYLSTMNHPIYEILMISCK